MSVLADKDVDSTMAADWAAIQERHAVEEPEAPEPQESAPVVEKADTRARDESGKFAPEPKEAAPVKEAAVREPRAAKVGQTAQPAAADPVAEPADTTRDINRAPSTWKPTARAEWEKLPPTVRTEIHRREADFMNGQSQLLPDAKFGKSVTDIVAPYRMLIESEGGTPERAIGDLLRTAAALRLGTPQQKVQTLAQVAHLYGVDLRAFAPQIGQPEQQQQQPLQDPRVDQLLAQMNQERQQTAQREQQTLEGAVTTWMNENDPQGKPLRPYLGDVMTEMGALVPQIRQTNPSLSHDQVLQQAYERAIWGNPEIRALLQTQQAQGTEQTRRLENQDRVREARRAASVNVPRRASIPSPGKPGSLDETIANTARELGLIT